MKSKKIRRRIEKKSSRTAAMTCVSRASSFYEKSPFYKSNDNIARRLLPKLIHFLIKSRRMRSLLLKKLAPNGIYEYVIARTKFIDEIFLNAILNNFDQILLFGAGFDSRGIRLTDKNERTKIFELDVKTTISDKLKQYKKRKIDPGNVVYVEIDFNKDKIGDKLKTAAFQDNKKTLYILEGITMYLDEAAVNEDFRFITQSAGRGSELVFDYIYDSVLKEMNLYYGEQEIFQRVKKSGEAWTFGIVKEEIINFLSQQGLELIEHMDSNKLEEKYFKDKDNKIVGKVNGTHCIVYAKIEE
ncbi:MAG: class I SAM-dependent methyltransferase [Promethearchaeota archaeon]